MANLPQLLLLNVAFGGLSISASSVTGAQGNIDRKMAFAEHLVFELINPEVKGNALLELSKVTTFLHTFHCLLM